MNDALSCFGMLFAERLEDPERREKALPPTVYDAATQTFRYRFDGHEYTAHEVFSPKASTSLKDELKSMSVTQGTTGKRDYCFI